VLKKVVRRSDEEEKQNEEGEAKNKMLNAT
jgi:hypothetical protein